MTRVRITGGFLNIGRRRPGHPDQGLPETEPGHPDQGLPGEGEGGYPDNELPPLPPGIWPPPTVSHPIVPVPPENGNGDGEGEGSPEHPIVLPPGAIWPKPPSPVEGLFVVLAHIPDMGWHYIVIDPDAWPSHPIAKPPGAPAHQPAPTPQPKRT